VCAGTPYLTSVETVPAANTRERKEEYLAKELD
jgi:hypothetical protein